MTKKKFVYNNDRVIVILQVLPLLLHLFSLFIISSKNKKKGN